MNLSAPAFLAKKEEINVPNSVFDKTDGTSLDQIADETHTAAPAVVENWINSTDGRPQTGLNVSNLRNTTKHTLVKRIQVKNELSFPAVTQGKELLRYPVVEQLA